MSTGPGRAGRLRSLQDELLEDLRQGAARPGPTAASPAESAPAAPETAPGPSPRPASPTPAIEVRFTPRSWSGAGCTRGPGEAGLTLSLGPLRLSLGLLHLA